MKPLHAQSIIDVYNQLSSFEGKKIILGGCKASGISDVLTEGLAGFSRGSIDPFYDIDPFDQGEVDFNIASIVNCVSEEYVEKEIVFGFTDNDDNGGELLPGFIRSDDFEYSSNHISHRKS